MAELLRPPDTQAAGHDIGLAPSLSDLISSSALRKPLLRPRLRGRSPTLALPYQNVFHSLVHWCSASKFDSTVGVGGTKDWNSSVVELYGDQSGSPAEFGLPVSAK